MKSTSAVKATLLTIFITFLLVGCGESNEMSQAELQYLSHLDQSRFFQRQGELKASTVEARSAIEMQPDRVDPYIVIINNLLTAGDARNAERQLDALLERIDPSGISQQNLNDAALLRAEARLMQKQPEAALEALSSIKEADRAQQAEAAILRGHIHLASDKPEAAREAYQQASELAPSSVEPLVGLSRTAFAENRKEESAEFIRQATEIDPEDVELLLWKARRAHTDKRWAEAEQAYVNALETIGRFDVMTYRKFETMSSLVDVLRQQGKPAEAFVYEEILARSAPGTLRSNLIAAQEALNNSEPDRAAGFLEEVLAQSPSHEQAAMMLGIIRFRQGRVEEAERLLAPIAAMDESDQVSRVLAATRLQMRDPEGAKAILANIDDQDSDPATLALVGIASLASGDRESGEQLIEKSLELNPDNNSLRLRYANYHIQNGDSARAMELAKQAIDRDSASASARQTLIRAQLASGDLDSAIATASDWLEKEPDSPFPLLAMGNVEQSRVNQDQARTFFADALRLEPDSLQALQSLMAITSREELDPLMAELRETNPDAIGPRLMLLESALIKGDQSLAEELTAGLIEREEQDTPTAAEPLVTGIYTSIASQMAQRERNEDAAAIFARGRALFPEDQNLGLRSAAFQFRQGNASEARKILSDVKQAHPDSPSPFVVEARYFEQQQNYRQATELFQLALDKEPRNPGLMMSLANLYQSNEKPDEARELYEQLIVLQPNNAAALNNLAWIYQEQGKEEALELALRAYELNPQNAAIADTYGWILLKNGQQAESVQILEKAHSLAPESGEIATHLAEAYKATGDDNKARDILEKLQ